MNKKTVLLVLLSVAFANLLKAQLVEFGVQASVFGSRFTVSENRLSDDILVRQGRIAPGGTIGALIEYGAPKDQPRSYLKLYSSLLAEFNFAYNPGNIEILLNVAFLSTCSMFFTSNILISSQEFFVGLRLLLLI